MLGRLVLRVRGLHPLWRTVPDASPRLDPHVAHLGFSAFARHYSRNRSLFLLLRVLRCFGSPGCLPRPMCSVVGSMHVACWVPPFGNPGIKAHVQLPQAYRRLSRPSSPSGSKASAACLTNFRLYQDMICRFSPDLSSRSVVIS